MSVLDSVLDDLQAESDQLERTLEKLPEPRWATPTPAEGWTIAHQVSHLAWSDETALTAAVDPMAFRSMVEDSMTDPDHYVHKAAEEGAGVPPPMLLGRWRESRRRLHETLRLAPAGTKIPWYGPSMSAATMATARLMETWAHGQDIYTALDRVPRPTDRIKHICHLAHRTRDFAYHMRGLTPPPVEIRLDLVAPSGARWTFGDPDAPQSISGSAYHLILCATRRRHRDDLDLVADGPDADEWLSIMQTFSGPPGTEPAPRGAMA
jgi:uncharacterized protein (TIGR03084 family)